MFLSLPVPGIEACAGLNRKPMPSKIDLGSIGKKCVSTPIKLPNQTKAWSSIGNKCVSRPIKRPDQTKV